MFLNPKSYNDKSKKDCNDRSFLGKGRLKNIDGIWFVLDKVWLVQTKLDKRHYNDSLYDGMQVEYNIYMDVVSPPDSYAIIRDISKERDEKINDILNKK